MKWPYFSAQRERHTAAARRNSRQLATCSRLAIAITISCRIVMHFHTDSDRTPQEQPGQHATKK
jgi:hypothetical protein